MISDRTPIAGGTSDLPAALGGVLDAAIVLAEADFGNIQLLGPDGHLRIVVHRGFPDWWVDYWNTVAIGQGACGTSLEFGERVFVEDVEQSPIFAGTPALDVQLRAGVRAVISHRCGAGQGNCWECFRHITEHRTDPQTRH